MWDIEGFKLLLSRIDLDAIPENAHALVLVSPQVLVSPNEREANSAERLIVNRISTRASVLTTHTAYTFLFSYSFILKQ